MLTNPSIHACGKSSPSSQTSSWNFWTTAASFLLVSGVMLLPLPMLFDGKANLHERIVKCIKGFAYLGRSFEVPGYILKSENCSHLEFVIADFGGPDIG
jgi:hypothetical protein